jgi:hypothetical protein
MRPERLTLSREDDPAPASDAVKDFLTMRGIIISHKALIETWHLCMKETHEETQPTDVIPRALLGVITARPGCLLRFKGNMV